MVTSGDVGAAFEFLMTRYLSLDSYDPDIEVTQSLVDERLQELDSLHSIYEDSCEERIANQLWIVHLDLPYLANIYCDQQTGLQQEENCDNKKTSNSKQNKELCKFFVKGYCKFGIMCKFSHDIREQKTVKCSSEELENMKLRSKFELEIRFPKGKHYWYLIITLNVVFQCQKQNTQ